MNNSIICRSWQLASAGLLRVRPIEKQEKLIGSGSLSMVGRAVSDKDVSRFLIITTAGTVKRGMLETLFEGLREEGISWAVYTGVVPDPDIECVEAAVRMYRDEHCDGIIAVGGGSAMDCAKMCGARVARPRTSVKRMAGLMRVVKKLPFFVAVPTTAGTGSEITAAAVITDKSVTPARKFTVMDFVLVPDMAVLDPDLTMKLPANLTAETGMDAFTHAIESYTNLFCSGRINDYAMEAMKLIDENLTKVVKAEVEGEELESARENLLVGSYYAGIAFTNGYVGYVHAIAHAVGALYHIPHGRACAMILPYVMEAYGESINKPMARISDTLKIKQCGSAKEKRDAVIEHIRWMNAQIGIGDRISEIQEADVEIIASRAVKEANPSYPVPVIFNEAEIQAIVRNMM